MRITYRQLKDSTWGIAVEGGTVGVGATVTVTKKSGETKQETVAKVLWQGTTQSGQPGCLCAIVPTPRAFAGGEPRRGARAGATYERGVGYVCDECGERATPGTRCWETGARH